MEDYLNQIQSLSDEIKLTSKRIDEMSIWLFLATLACWSVTNQTMKVISLFVIFFYLIDHVVDGNYSKKSYTSRINDIEKRANASTMLEPEKNQVIGALQRYCKNELGYANVFKKNYKYVVAAIFYSASFVLFWAPI